MRKHRERNRLGIEKPEIGTSIKKTIPLSKFDLKLLQKNRSHIWLVSLIGSALFFLLILFFKSDLLFGNSKSVFFGWSFALFPLLIGILINGSAKIDTLIGKKQVLRGIVTNMKNDYHHGEDGTQDTRTYYVYLGKKRYTVPEEEYRKASVGQTIEIHRTLIFKKVFLIENLRR